MKKRLTAIIIAAAMLFAAAAMPAYAALTMDDIVFELKTLKVMEGDDDGEFHLEKPVTRAEFAAIASRMMSMEDAAASYKNEKMYDDVGTDHWANGYIVMLSHLGIISGIGDNKFGPDEYLSYENICKILVCCLGYSIQGENNGGYPGGYTLTAGTIGLLKGVNISYPFTREATARMVYNALYVKIMTTEMRGGKVDYVISNTTFRDKFTTVADGSVEKREGIVTATVDAYMNNALSDMNSGQIEIDNSIYYINDPAAARYIGQRVVYYVNTEESNKIISLRPSEYNEVITIPVKDIKEADASSITYYTEGNTSKTKKLIPGVRVLKNNRPVPSWNPEEFLNLEQGELTLINNTSDSDNDIDIILYKSYVSVIVEDVNAERGMIYFSDSTLLGGKKYIDVDTERNSNKRIVLYKSDGTPASAEDVLKDNVISICQSDDKNFTEGIICDAFVDGKLTACDDDTVTINGKVYPTERDEVKDNAVFDRDIRAYMNYMGEVVYIKTITTSTNYGYAASIFMDDSATYAGVKMIIPNKLSEKKEEEENEDGGDATIISKIIASNEELRNMYLAANVYVSGINGSTEQRKLSSKTAAEYILNKAVRYTLNSKDEIDSVVILKPERGGDKKVYNSYERTFAKGNGDNTDKGGFGVDFETRTICVPDSEKPSSRDYLANVEMSNGKTYNVISYEMNEDRHVVDLIVVTAPMKDGTVGELTSTSEVGFVTDVVTVMDEDSNEETLKITMLNDEGKEKVYDITEAYREYEKYEVPRRGSLVAYLLNNEGKIENLKIVKSYDVMPQFGLDSASSSYTIFVGYALDADYNYVSNQYNRWVTRINVSPALDEESSLYYEVYKNNPPPVFIFNRADKSAEFADMRAVAVGSDVISVFSTNGKVRAVVVIR